LKEIGGVVLEEKRGGVVWEGKEKFAEFVSKLCFIIWDVWVPGDLTFR